MSIFTPRQCLFYDMDLLPIIVLNPWDGQGERHNVEATVRGEGTDLDLRAKNRTPKCGR